MEQNIESLKVQDFETYEDFYVKYVYPKSKSSKEQSKFLHNQQFFSTLLSQLQPGKQLKCSRTEKNGIFYKFSKYVTLKDIKSKDKNYYRFACSLLLLLALLPIVYVIHALWPLFVLNALFTLNFFLCFLIFKGRINLFFFNCIRINKYNDPQFLEGRQPQW